MILSHFDLEKPIELNSSVVNVLVVENETKFFDFCKEFAVQSKGGDGGFALFDENEKLSVARDVKFVYDFFDVSFGDRRAQNGLICCLEQIAESSLAAEYADLTEAVFSFLEKLNGETDFSIEYNSDGSLPSLLKAYGVRWQEEHGSLLETLVSLIHFNARILKTKCFVFANLKCFLSENDLRNLYYEAGLEDVCLFLLESSLKAKLDGEFVTVIDGDLCEIVV